MEKEELLCAIRENFKTASEYYSYQRSQAQEDFRFRAGEQWPSEIKAQRILENRPCITVNKMGQFVRQVVNNQKINRPSINVKAVDAFADIKMAKIIQAIIKNIEEQSFAENAYDVAFDCACTGGEGYFRIITDYSDSLSFDQEIYIKPIDNPFSVYIDPNFKSDYTDMEYAFVFDTITKKEFERLYPNSEYTSNTNLNYKPDHEWLSENEIRITEYFYIDREDVEIVLLSTGQVLEKKDWEALDNKEDVEVLKERVTSKKIVKWVKTNGYEILEETVFPGSRIPIIPVFADMYMVDGKKVYEGVIRQAKSPQSAYNYWVSAETEMIALAPKAPYLVAAGQIDGHEHEWENANSKSLPYLTYNAKSSNGADVGPPQRAQFDPAINTITQAKASSNEDLKATTGIYDPSLGKEQREASGIALITKQRQAEVTSFMYIDNLSKALKLAGRTILDMLPEVYDTKRVMRIVGDNNTPDEVMEINTKDFFLGVGKYDVSITIGPYGENQRQQAIESMLSLMQINPEIAGLIGDIFVAKQDWDGAQEIAERLKIMLPPALQKNNKDIPPELQAQLAQVQQQYETKIAQDSQQMQQMQQMISDLTASFNKADAELRNKQAEIESKERIAAMQARVDLIKIGMTQEAADGRLAFQEELKFSQAKQNGQANIPMQNDSLVVSGVNDPVTKEKAEDKGDLTPEDGSNLLSELDKYIN